MEVSVYPARAVRYRSPKHVQIWFLLRSRQLWKQKYMQLKTENKRMRNRVGDATRSRKQWREQAEEQSRRVESLEAQNAQLNQQLERLQKIGTQRWRVGL